MSAERLRAGELLGRSRQSRSVARAGKPVALSSNHVQGEIPTSRSDQCDTLLPSTLLEQEEPTPEHDLERHSAEDHRHTRRQLQRPERQAGRVRGYDHDKLAAEHLDPTEHRHERVALAKQHCRRLASATVAAHGTLSVSVALGG